MPNVMSFLAPIVGDIYHGREFDSLVLPKPTLNMFDRAYKLYNQRRYDLCLIEVWKYIEGILKKSYSNYFKDTAQLIWKLKEKGVLEESDVFFLHGIRCYRNKAIHESLTDKDILLVKGILILSVPMIWSLIQQLG